MKFAFVLALLAVASVLTAFDVSGEESSTSYFSAEQMATAASLRDAALKDNETWELLEELVSVAPKRLAGSPGDKVARDWAVQKLESLGFDRVWVQEFQLRGWARESASATVLSHDHIDLDITSLGKSVSTPAGGVTAQVMHFRTLADLEAATESDVEGKIVFHLQSHGTEDGWVRLRTG